MIRASVGTLAEHGGLEEIALVADPPAARPDLAATGDRVGHQRFERGNAPLVGERPHRDALLEPVADPDGFRLGGEGVEEPFESRLLDEKPRR